MKRDFPCRRLGAAAPGGSLAGVALLLAAFLAACSAAPPPVAPKDAALAVRAAPARPALPARVLAVTATHELIAFDAAAPERVLERRSVAGLGPGERLVGIDFRVARGVLYALSQKGRLYTLDAASGVLTPVGAAPAAGEALPGVVHGFDFNPAADRIRVVSHTGLNLRLHPDTGAIVDGDPAAAGVQGDAPLRYAAGDPQAGKPANVAGVAYTYNTRDGQLTTNFAIDRTQGTLVLQGSREGAVPVESPNAGQLRTVGPLGLGPLADAAFDIADVDNTALAAVRTRAEAPTRLYRLDLATGAAQLLGKVADGAPLLGMAIAP